MFILNDPERYFRYAYRLLETAGNLLETPTKELIVSPDFEKWSKILWRLSVDFDSGHQLIVRDIFCRDPRGDALRSFTYQLTSPRKDFIFRLDTHGKEIGLDGCCHLHFPTEKERIEEGDAKLNGFSLQGIHFLKVFKIVHKRIYKDKLLPWE